jgi:Tol biopolymer transport system component
VLRACLHKDPDHRLHSIADARIGIENAASQSRASRIRFRARSVAAIASLLFLTLAVVAAYLWRPPYFSRSEETQLNAVPFTTYPGIERQPVFSPDGNEVAFVWRSEESDAFNIFRKIIGSGDARPLTKDSTDHHSPAWSPDGKFIAYLANRSGKRCLCIMPALGGAEQTVTYLEFVAGNIFRPAPNIAWTPDSRYLIVPNGKADAAQAGLFRIAADTGEMKRLTSCDTADWDPSISPDGQEVAFVRRSQLGISDVYKIHLAGDFQPIGEPERITFEKRNVFTPVWTEDGKQIVFSSGTWLSERRLFKVPARGIRSAAEYRPKPLPMGENAGTLAVSNRSHRLAYSREFWNGNIYRVELVNGKAGKMQRLLSSTWSSHTPDFSPDGKRLAFASTRSGNEEIWRCDADGGNERQLTFLGAAMASVPRWSPDGKLILFQSMKEGSVDLYTINAEGGQPQRLTCDPQTETEASWSRDGKWIYFWSNRSGKNQVYKMPALGGSATQLTMNGGAAPKESVNGQWVYYWKQQGLWKTPSSGGEELRELERVGYQLNFVVADKGIYFLDQVKEMTKVTLFFFSFASRELTPLMEISRFAAPWPLGLAISPDQRCLLFHLWDRFDGDLMLVENFR